MNLDEELENLKNNPEKELDKMKSSPNSNPKSDEKVTPNVEGPNVEGPNVEGPNVEGTNVEGPNINASEGDKGDGKQKSSGGDHEEVYKVLDQVLTVLIEKLKLVFMMPYVFFKHYVKDFISENESGERQTRDIRPAVVSFVLVVVGEFGISWLTNDFSMVKLIPIAGCLVLCMMDSDKYK